MYLPLSQLFIIVIVFTANEWCWRGAGSRTVLLLFFFFCVTDTGSDTAAVIYTETGIDAVNGTGTGTDVVNGTGSGTGVLNGTGYDLSFLLSYLAYLAYWFVTA